MFDIKEINIAVVGLGYVGLPLAVEFGKYYPTIGFDIRPERVAKLSAGHDATLEVESAELAEAKKLSYTSTANDIAECNFYIITVPTPIDKHRKPDLYPLESASVTIGKYVRPGDVVVLESTVYPGATEEVCVPLIEQESGLVFNKDFYMGYSPERINPGDKVHRITTITKVTSGSTPGAAEFVDEVYKSIIIAGTHKASSIRVAEAAKVIENTQRDVNIALINELALIFNLLDIDTIEVLEAAGTKWNFLPFRPGLVGGHCISVDPYYLTHKAQEIGYNPDVILAGRRINDGMGAYVAERVVKLMTQRKIHIVGSNILVLGLTFKENCPDLRNTRVIDMIKEFESYHASVDVCDPWVDPTEAQSEYGIQPIQEPNVESYDAIILAVGHEQFNDMGSKGIRELGRKNCVVYDVKSILPKDYVEGRL